MQDKTKVKRSPLMILIGAGVLITAQLVARAEEPAGLLPRSSENFSEQREQARIHRAVAHYTRAHSLLLAAISEFDKAKSLADPSLLLDDEKWRSTLTRKAKELQRVLAPQPREARAGVRLSAEPRLLGRNSNE
jgi:hypothetical protein